jgi:chemotaxis protein MotB
MAKKKAAAHHGGAWKVAYADFVTAMMALFMVLWICSQDDDVMVATSRYFQSPFDSPLSASSGLLDFESNSPANTSGASGETGDAAASQNSAATIDLQFLNSVAKDFFKMLNLDESMADKPIDVQVTSDGLRITLFDRRQQALFEEQSATFTSWGIFVMQSMAWVIDRNGFNVVIEGHTRGGLSFPEAGYSAWELSTDRANASRRALVRYAVEPHLIERVSGYADTQPVPLSAPDDPANQRVTLSLRMGGKTKRPTAVELAPATLLITPTQ